MKKIKFFIIAFFIFAQSLCRLNAYYVKETFSSLAGMINNGWYTNYFYGRDGLLRVDPDTDAGCNSEQDYTSISTSGNNLQFRGTPNEDNLAYQSIWLGHMVIYTNRDFTATPFEPFGFEVIKSYSWLDPVAGCREGSGDTSMRQKAEAGIWLVSTNIIPEEFTPYVDFIDLHEFSQGERPDLTYNTTRSQFGYFDGVQRFIDLTLATNAKGGHINLLDTRLPGANMVEWEYDDVRGGTANTNDLGMRITHDGSNINMYLNLNPDSNPNNSFPNEWCWVSKKQVTWNEKLTIMLGHCVNRFDQERVDIDFQNLLVRSVSKSSYLEIKTLPGISPNFRYQLTLIPEFEKNNAGIGEIILIKKAELSAFPWDESSIEIFTDYQNSGNLKKLNNILDPHSIKNGQAFIKINQNICKIRFCQISDIKNNVIDYNNPNQNIRIQVNLPQTNVDDPDRLFEVFVDCKKYAETGYTRYATTGPQKCRPYVPLLTSR